MEHKTRHCDRQQVEYLMKLLFAASQVASRVVYASGEEMTVMFREEPLRQGNKWSKTT